MQGITSINPAAVLGASLGFIRFDDKAAAGAYMQAYRDSKRSSKLSGSAFIRDLSTVLRIKALPLMQDADDVQDWDADRTLNFRGLEYDQLVALVGEMYRYGVRPSDPLLCEQAQVASTGRVPLDYRTAYDQFVAEADRLLLRIDSLRLPELVKTKGVRTTVAPRKARALTAGSKGVHVLPDPYNARYVRVHMQGMDEAAGYAVRELAFDHYESQGLRVQLYHV